MGLARSAEASPGAGAKIVRSLERPSRLGHWIFAADDRICLPRAAAPPALNQQTRPKMSTFDKREESFEKTFVHEEELHFRAEARRNKLLGLWAAEKLGKTGAEAQAYADALVAAEAEPNADEVVVARVLKDFVAAGVDQSEHQIRRNLDEFLAQATAEIKAGK